MADSGCASGHSALCTALNCMDDLIQLAICYVSLAVLVVNHIRQKQPAHYFAVSNSAAWSHEKSRPARSSNLLPVNSLFVIAIEAVGLLIDLSFAVALLVRGQDCPLAFSSVFFSIYLLVLLTGRVNQLEEPLHFHSGILYVLRWLFLAINAGSLFVGKPGVLDLVSVVVRFAVFTGLCILHGLYSYSPSKKHGSGEEPGKEDRASLMSRLTFSWMDSLVWKAFQRPLEAFDLYHLSREQRSRRLVADFRFVSASTSFVFRLLQSFKSDFLIQGAWAFVASISALLPPLLIQRILKYVEARRAVTETDAWLCVTGLLLSGLITTTADSQANWIWRKIGAKARSVLLNEMHDKILRRGVPSSANTSAKTDARDPATETEAEIENNAQDSDGNVLSLISVDVEVISNIIGSLYLVWITFPVQIGLGTYLLYTILGAAGIVGVVFMLLLLPLNFVISRKLMSVQGKVLTATDARLQASNEVLTNIRNIKYCAWEQAFDESVQVRRETELKRMWSRFIWWSCSMNLFFSLPIIMTAFTLFFYTIVWGNKLGTDVAFPAIAMFTVMRIPINRMADSVNFWLQAFVSFKRVSKLLSERESTRHSQLSWQDTDLIGFEAATLAWSNDKNRQSFEGGNFEMQERSSQFHLRDLQIFFHKKGLNVITGPSGSGKSSLLLALLGEMDLVSGRVLFPLTDPENDGRGTNELSQTTAYCPQEPWILNKSIRDNILLGRPMNNERYERVLHAVALLPDLASLSHGDETVAGENGGKLSGGQKQRVALARALYSQARFVLLDDALSAVDGRNAQHILAHAILGPLMQDRTCILATHNTQLAVPHAQLVVMLDAHGIKAQGTPSELAAAGVIDPAIVKAKGSFEASWGDLLLPTPEKGDMGQEASHDRLPEHQDSLELQHDDEESANKLSKSEYTESKPEGLVPWPTISFWLRSMGPEWYWFVVLLLFAIQQAAGLGITLWMKRWTTRYDNQATNDRSHHGHSHSQAPGVLSKDQEVADGYFLLVYLLFNLLHSVVMFARDMGVFWGSLRASRSIYSGLLKSILGSTLQFFDRVPIGQITNRFSRDIEIIDQSLPTFSLTALQLAASLALIVIFISYYVPEFLVPGVFIFLGYYWVCAVYLHAARDLKRIEAVTRSPLYQQFGETIAGVVSVKAYGLTAAFRSKNHQLVDQINSPYLLQFSSKEWLSYRIGVFSSLILFSAGAFLVLRGSAMSTGIAGIILTYAASFTETMSWLVQIYAFVQQDFNSIERVTEYIGIEQEASRPLKPMFGSLPGAWPEHGFVKFENYDARYAPHLELSLKNITFSAPAGKRVAIVGRTGAGKTTLGLALIRGLESAAGHIEIDGIDISCLTLKQLRKAVALVPQDPKLFSGSIRHNLSPLYRPDDDRMLDVLRTVRVFGSSADPQSIKYSDLDRPADSLSRGQRQLLCIARGLLRNSKILILDEATANVDHATDAAVQAGLRASVAAGTTVLTIAHRLNTIADYDHIVVLDRGEVVEQGSPDDLLARRGENALFRRMCIDAGEMDAFEEAARRRSEID